MVKLRSENARDRLISLVRYGKVTPEQAEAEAASRGWPPFAREPKSGTFEPLKESRWPIVILKLCSANPLNFDPKALFGFFANGINQ
jgi:hypothetical protein